MSLNDVISSLSSGDSPYTVTRTATGSSTKGRYTSGAVTTFTIVAGIDPVTGIEVQDGSEGQFGNDRILIFTATELRASATPSDEADKIEWEGDLYQVVTCKRWDGLGEVHFEATAARITTP